MSGERMHYEGCYERALDLRLAGFGSVVQPCPGLVPSPEVAERVAVLTAHRACIAAEHDPANGKMHGFCVVCGAPWPCGYAGKSSLPVEVEALVEAARLVHDSQGKCGMAALCAALADLDAVRRG